jgi:hypothetical protein
MQADNGAASNSATAPLRIFEVFNLELNMLDLWR